MGWLIQRIKAMLLCFVYAMLFVDSVDIYTEKSFGMPPYVIACSMY